jgi:ribosome-associated heat shock protein Hsp15
MTRAFFTLLGFFYQTKVYDHVNEKTDWIAALAKNLEGISTREWLMDAIRIDKWLWAARFFKTRALASRACELGRIQSNGLRAKPAREVRSGDKLRIENESGVFDVEVLGASQVRGPAAMAQLLYRETEASREARLKAAAERKAMEQYMPLPERRPSKRDRRRIIRFRSGR